MLFSRARMRTMERSISTSTSTFGSLRPLAGSWGQVSGAESSAARTSSMTARASRVVSRSRIPRTMNRSSIVRGSRRHDSTICSSVSTHLRGTLRLRASISRQAAISRAAAIWRRDSCPMCFKRRHRSCSSGTYDSGFIISSNSASSQCRRPFSSSCSVMDAYILGR